MFDLSGKKAFITGGSGSLGKSISKALASAGAEVIIAGIEQLDKLKDIQREFESDGYKASVMHLDVSNPQHLQSLTETLKNDHGHIDILVNGAGINVRGPILETSIEDWDRVVNINLRGTFFVSQAVARLMFEQNSGKIINICSLSSHIGLPNMGPYCASKGGVNQITKAMAIEWASCIQVNAIAPGYFHTELTAPLFKNPEWYNSILKRIPQGRTGVPEDLAGTAIFLASDASNYITGQTIYVDGGWIAS
ncbi:short-chain dehydrogenase [Alicyclobacillus fastidiosus]|nr:short-chain dehydrogenase [Alicyclobacillus fastidiosus]